MIMPLTMMTTMMMMHHPLPITVLLVMAVEVWAMTTMKTMMMMPKMPIMTPTMMMPPMALKVRFVMAPILKRTTPCCHVLTSPFSQMFLNQSLSHYWPPVAIPNGMPARKSRVMTLGSNHPMVKMSVPFLMNMYLVLVVAVNPLPQDLFCLNQLRSCLLMVFIGS